MADVESLAQPEQPPYSERDVYAAFLTAMPDLRTTSVAAAAVWSKRSGTRHESWAGYVPSDRFIARPIVQTESSVPPIELLEAAFAKQDAEDLGALPVAQTVMADSEALPFAPRPAQYRHEQGTGGVRSHRRGLVGRLKNLVRAAD